MRSSAQRKRKKQLKFLFLEEKKVQFGCFVVPPSFLKKERARRVGNGRVRESERNFRATRKLLIRFQADVASNIETCIGAKILS